MWLYFAVFAVTLLATYAFAPKPQTQPPPQMGDIEAPIAKLGADIPVLFGCRLLRGPSVVWYGNVGTEPIKAESEGKK